MFDYYHLFARAMYMEIYLRFNAFFCAECERLSQRAIKEGYEAENGFHGNFEKFFDGAFELLETISLDKSLEEVFCHQKALL